jgi:hypothetical protein
MSSRQPDENEQYCRECGEIILTKAEVCPECGVRNERGAPSPGQSRPTGGATTPQNAHGAQSRPNGGAQANSNVGMQQQTRQSYGIIFAIIDSWKYQRPLRHLFNIILAFSTVGVYLVILLIEGLIHYRNLNNGDSQPYDESKPKVWSTFTHVQ